MLFLNNQNFVGKFCARFIILLPKIKLTRLQKILFISLTTGTILLGSLAQFLKRRRRHPVSPSRRYLRDSRQRLIHLKASNFDAVSQASWTKRSDVSSRSCISDKVSIISSVPGALDRDIKLTPQQYGVLGKFV